MAVDPVALATTALLVKSIEGIGSEMGKSAWTKVQGLVETIRKKFAGDAQAERALARLEEAPDRAHTQALAMVLHARAEADPRFRAEIVAILDEISRDPAAGRFITEISGSAYVGKVANIGEVHGDVTI